MMTDMFSGYEKQIEDLTNERDRLNTIAYNAIDYMLCEAGMTVEEICEYIGCTMEDLLDHDLINDLID